MPIFGKRRGEEVKKFYELDLEEGAVGVLYLGLSGMLIRVMDRTIALDVADFLGKEGISEVRELCLLLYTHGHYDHYSGKECLRIIERTGAKVLAESSVFNDLRGKISQQNLYEALSGRTYNIEGLNIETIRGVHVGPIILYIIDVEGIRIFHGGDSGYIALGGHTADLAFVPTGSPSPTASPNDAFKMIVDLKPKVAVPIHGSRGEHENFKRLVEKEAKDTRVEIIEEFNPTKLRIF